MAYTLKSSGLATDLIFCVAIDEDGSIKEFVSSSVNSNKTTTGVTTGTSSWKGTTRGYFETYANGTFDALCVKFTSGFRPSIVLSGPGTSSSCFFACAGMGSPGGTPAIIHGASDFVYVNGSRKLVYAAVGTIAGTTSLPTDGTTKFSAGANFESGVDWGMFYGLESGSLATDGSGSESGTGGTISVTGVGGGPGAGNQPGKYHIICAFDRELNTDEFQSLHGNGTNDWFSTLFDAPVGGMSKTTRMSLMGIG